MARKKNFNELEVLDKAVNLFWEKGYGATSIQDLVDGLGINRASIYATWGDKHQLYLSALQRYRQNASSWLLNEIRTEPSALVIIERFLYFTIDSVIHDNDKRGCFILNSSTELSNSDSEVDAIVLENRQTMEKVLTELIKEGQADGEINKAHSPESMGRYIFSTVNGLRVLGMGQISEEELKEVVQVSISALK
ncbi:MAG: TetR/AcrR family transcriptional repressor of nem operon [Roseivirga sp.]|jgi:TetR/AcrR family transcriptional repressor of nem operon